MIALAKRIEAVGFSASLAIAERARQLRAAGKPVIDMSLGELDFDTPPNVRAAAKRAIDEGKTRYDSAAGNRALREAICRKLQRENRLRYRVDEIAVGCGAKQIISSALVATVERGVEVLIPVPYWTSYPEIVRLADGTPVLIPCRAEDGFKLSPTVLRESITPRTRWLFLNSPNNPTGAVYSAKELEALAEVLLEFPHVGIISDDIYEHIVFAPTKFRTIAEVVPALRPRTLVVNGVSKTYAMTGWRVGYGAGPMDLIRAINIVQSQTTTHTCTISQHAAIEALDGPQDVRDRYSRAMESRARTAMKSLRRIKAFTCSVPAGAFYCFVGCASLVGKRGANGALATDADIARHLLEEALVACVPGSAYGLSPYLRFSFAADATLVRDAFDRVRAAVDRLTETRSVRARTARDRSRRQ